jgi:hypothetical protein
VCALPPKKPVGDKVYSHRLGAGEVGVSVKAVERETYLKLVLDDLMDVGGSVLVVDPSPCHLFKEWILCSQGVAFLIAESRDF